MPKYIIWDKQSDIYTTVPHHKTGKSHYTAQEYIDEVAPWAGIPGAKVIVGGGAINGTFFENFDERFSFYKNQGVAIDPSMTDREILDAMEAYDLNPPSPEEEVTQILKILLGGY